MATPAPPLADALAAFDSLSPAERKTYLTELSKRFRSSDWRYIRKMVSAREASPKDLSQILPIELVTQIFEYLMPRELAPCLLVNKNWNALLKEEHICRAIVQRWYPDESQRATQRPWKWILENAVSREIAILRARPSSMVVLPKGISSTGVSFMDRRMAAIHSKNPGFVFVYDLSSCTFIKERLTTPDRSTLSDVWLMKDFVVARTQCSTTIYVWNLETSELRTVRLPNTDLRTFEVDGNSFVALFYGSADFFLYDATTNTSRMISCVEDRQITSIILDMQNKRITAVAINESTGNVFGACAKTYATTGELLKVCSGTFIGTVDVPFFDNSNLRWGEDLYLLSMAWYQPLEGSLHYDGGHAHALLFDKKTCCFIKQRLWYKDMDQSPDFFYTYEGTVYGSMPNGMVVAMHVPMDGKGYFNPVETSIINRGMGYRLHPVYIVPDSHGSMVVCLRECFPGEYSLVLYVYKGLHEIREGFANGEGI
ncbi:hypothetical protein FN846DRAFT_979381 [Sphaerosporella brunnea]|uniref:F-box domain-containing protein n=1 Tax=Sphaerosporella brunnea TaxID=1250544 RepID=A0A5J5EE71_9PEZI|nr:hypothetical protein FN846DRAFT_979381 [Sphaerosporella brunnea]